MTALEFVQQWNNREYTKYPIKSIDDWREILYVIQSGDEVYSETIGESRWYDHVLVVVKMDDKFIGYNWYHITGDDRPFDIGLELDLDSVKFYEPIEVKTTVYKEVTD